MQFANIEKTLRAWQNVHWGTGQNTQRVAYANQDFTPADKETWMRMEILEGNVIHDVITGDITKGSLVSGFVAFQLFAPLGIGNGVVMSVVDALSTIWQNKAIPFVGGGNEPIITKLCQVTKPGIQDAWYQVNNYIPFEFLVLI